MNRTMWAFQDELQKMATVRGVWRYLNKPVSEVARDVSFIPVAGLLADAALVHPAPLFTALGLAIPALMGYGAYRGLKAIGETGGENVGRLYEELKR